MTPTIHENQTPPERDGELHTVTMQWMTRGTLDAWLEKRGITEAWVYDSEVGRVMSWYTKAEEE